MPVFTVTYFCIDCKHYCFKSNSYLCPWNYWNVKIKISIWSWVSWFICTCVYSNLFFATIVNITVSLSLNNNLCPWNCSNAQVTIKHFTFSYWTSFVLKMEHLESSDIKFCTSLWDSCFQYVLLYETIISHTIHSCIVVFSNILPFQVLFTYGTFRTHWADTMRMSNHTYLHKPKDACLSVCVHNNKKLCKTRGLSLHLNSSLRPGVL